ncbi:hypothetical protein [Clostridium cochlearium]|uniref:hypothetical protein n=1 Tax=Clostridium cochlearium TaxID=1494 RepID=UPI00214A8484|nr:hypothetical protein [Clostridium cochlearium]MBE6065286.1 hypothetical protein [Clostridium cochlearium]MCR1970359.1 hypothetical protein [Clostridium cochlearium]
MRNFKYGQGGGIINKGLIPRIKEFISFLSDRKLLLGIGIGIVMGITSMIGVKINYNLSDYEIEKRARSMGMKYPEEVKVIIDKDVNKK